MGVFNLGRSYITNDVYCYTLAATLGLVITPLSHAVKAATTQDEASASAAHESSVLDDATRDLLLQRGIDPRLAEYFSKAPRFAPGAQVVALSVNGMRRGKVTVQIDENGQLCFEPGLFEGAGLLPPLDANVPCQNFVASFPETRVELHPERAEIVLLVPEEALKPIVNVDTREYSRGGYGGLFNYNFLGFENQFDQGSQRSLSGNTELGINAGDWIVRSRQSYSQQKGQSSLEHLYTYAQTNLVDQRSVLQLGQINLNSPVLAGAPITGVQILPEVALTPSGGGGGSVEGIAQTQARVDVHQAGALIYSTVVPPGPFSLSSIPLLNAHTDLSVTVTETDGSERTFSVPAVLVAGSPVQQGAGYTLAAGQVRRFDGGPEATPAVISGSRNWQVSRSTSVAGGAMFAEGYKALGAGMNSQPLPSLNVGVQTAVSQMDRDGQGARLSVSLQQRLNDSFSATASVSRNTRDYRDLLDLQLLDPETATNGRERDQYTLGLSWVDPLFGGFGASYSRSNAFNGTRSGHASLSWGRSFRKVSISATAEFNLEGDATSGSDNAFYVSVSVPFGSARVRSSVNHRNEATRYSTAISDRINDYASYSAGIERESETSGTDYNGTLSLLPRYTQVNLGFSESGASSSKSVAVSGGIAFHEGGGTFSPYAIQDTFGLASVGDVGGVKLTTPSGPVWTDWSGRAVVSSIAPYSMSQVEVVTKTLPRNVDIENARLDVLAGRGTVERLNFNLHQTRRVLLQTTMTSGEPLPQGAFVMDDKGELLATVNEKSEIFLSQIPEQTRLLVHLPSERSCELRFSLAQEPDLENYYETLPATCATVDTER